MHAFSWRIAAPLRTAFTAAELGSLVAAPGATVYLGELDLYHNVAAIDDCDSYRRTGASFSVRHATVWMSSPGSCCSTGRTASRPSRHPILHQPAVVINTSGTTGQPKFVMHSAATLGETLRLIVRHWGVSDNDVIVQALPLAHIAGLIFSRLYLSRRTFCPVESFDAETVLDAIATLSLHLLFWVPGHNLRVARSPARPATRSLVIAALSHCRRMCVHRTSGTGDVRRSRHHFTTFGAHRKLLDL